jgi:RIO-like serine/threonine protein kinase
MKSRDVGAMQVPEGERYFLIFKRLAPFKGEPTPEQRADLSAKITLMHKEGKHTHGDLHTGNLLVMPDGKLVFNDFDLGQPISKGAAAKQLQIELGLVKHMRPQVMVVGYGRPFV